MNIIAYLGPEKTNTHLAAVRRFGRKCFYRHAPTVEEVFHMVERRQAHYGVVPIENSLGGAVTHTLDRYIDFIDTPVRIHGEIDQPIRHGLVIGPQTKKEQIQVIYSHPQAFEQCKKWLNENLPGASHSETDSTAEAVQRLLYKKIGSWSSFYTLNERAAIGPEELAKEHGLNWRSIPQDRENRTRFLILGLGEYHGQKKRNKTSLMMVLKDAPGALYNALGPFKKNGINLTKIESRPSKGRAWEYVFFIDMEGDASDPKLKRALTWLKKSTTLLRILGSYPAGGRR